MEDLELEKSASEPATPNSEQAAGAAQQLSIAAVQLKIVGENLGILQDYGKQLELVSSAEQLTCRVSFKDGTYSYQHTIKELLCSKRTVGLGLVYYASLVALCQCCMYELFITRGLGSQRSEQNVCIGCTHLDGCSVMLCEVTGGFVGV